MATAPGLFWQWTQTGTMSGVRTEVDRNAFYGSEDDWVTFLLTGCDPRTVDRLGPAGPLPEPQVTVQYRRVASCHDLWQCSSFHS